MEIKQSDFIISAVTADQYPKDDFPEVAFVGKSNVGKSSLINALTNRRKLAKVSGTPGKTRLVNFFLINKSVYFVDLPGYGYAKISREQQKTWGKMIESYLQGRRTLKKFVLLVDSRHKPTEDDIIMHSWIKHYGVECIVVATKVDKLTKSEIAKSQKLIKETLEFEPNDKLVYISSSKKTGMQELIDTIFDELINTENQR